MTRDNFKIKRQYRLPDWDYSGQGYYFVTICTKDRVDCFGEIKNDKMELSYIGRFIRQQWMNLSDDEYNINIDEYVVMPNHLHGIIAINKKRKNLIGNSMNRISTTKIKNNPMLIEHVTLGGLIRQYKARTKYWVNRLQNDVDFSWQSKFYDRIIRDDNELNEIRKYIRNNPLKFDLDRNNLPYEFDMLN